MSAACKEAEAIVSPRSPSAQHRQHERKTSFAVTATVSVSHYRPTACCVKIALSDTDTNDQDEHSIQRPCPKTKAVECSLSLVGLSTATSLKIVLATVIPGSSWKCGFVIPP